MILLGSYALSMRLAIGAFTVSYRAPVPEEVTLYFSYGGIEFVRTFVRLLFTELPVMLGPFLMVFLGVGLFHRVKNQAASGCRGFSHSSALFNGRLRSPTFRPRRATSCPSLSRCPCGLRGGWWSSGARRRRDGTAASFDTRP
jgi:hypothetical protein